MREIKFRGRSLSGEWLYGDLLHRDGKVYILPEDAVDSIDNYEVDPATVGQFTVMKDKNGREIYEGDIIRWTRKNMYEPGASFHHQDIELICNVYYDERRLQFMRMGKFSTGGGFGGSLDFEDDRAEETIFEVIGNIHDNPELMEDKE